MKKKITIFAIAALVLLAGFSGCLGERQQSRSAEPTVTPLEIADKGAPAASPTTPPSTSPTTLPLETVNKLILPEEKYQGIPVLAPLLKRGIEVRIGSNSSCNLNFSDVSYFSSQAALAFWNKSEKAIVVDNYSNALTASALASVLDIPLLYYGETTGYAIEKLGCKEVIAVGNFSYQAPAQAAQPQAGVLELDENSFLDYFIGLRPPSYLVVANPYDNETLKSYYPQGKQTPHTPHLSCLAPLFAAHYGGMIVTATSDPHEIDRKIEWVARRMHDLGIEKSGGECMLRHLLLVGDAVSLTPVYYWFETITPNGGAWWFCTPTDNPYADLDGKTDFEHEQGEEIDERILTPELACGRLVAKTLEDGFNYAYRIFNYNSLLSGWEKNALIWCGALAEPGEGHNILVQSAWLLGGFSVKDDTVEAHTFNSGAIAADMQNSNFIAAVADHGSPSGNTVQYGDLKPMPPNIVFPVSCLMGQIDNYQSDWGVTKKNSFTYAVLEKGAAAYVAPTRPTVCGMLLLQGDGLILAHEDAGILCYQFYGNLINSNCTAGEALMSAKPNAHPYINCQYTLYGDPGFNPYEPKNNG